jgi:hypothetical protein
MAKSKNLTDKEKLEIIKEEIHEFNKLVGGHRKLLEAIGKL